MTRRSSAVVVLTAAWIAASAFAQAPPQGHPLVPAYPGSWMDQPADVSAFDEFEVPTGPIEDGKLSKAEHLEGKVTMFMYRTPEGRSPLEVFRNYESGFKEAGFATLFTCKGEQCGSQIPVKGLGYLPYADDARYLALKLARPEGDVYVAMHVETIDTRFVVVEVQPMETGLVKISAEALGSDLDHVGHVAVYEILFDTARADLKPESDGALTEVAALMARSPALRLHVVGHTDNVGTLAANLDLSKRRAEAVVAALTTTYKVAVARLHADGVGPLAPVASNDGEAGRAKNRRVELVKQ
jgi:OOP family OmpA-OmpF porin